MLPVIPFKCAIKNIACSLESTSRHLDKEVQILFAHDSLNCGTSDLHDRCSRQDSPQQADDVVPLALHWLSTSRIWKMSVDFILL